MIINNMQIDKYPYLPAIKNEDKVTRKLGVLSNDHKNFDKKGV